MIHSSFDGPLSSSSDSEEESDRLLSPLESFIFSLLFSVSGSLTVPSANLAPLRSEEIAPGKAAPGEGPGEAPGSCNFFFIRSSAEDDTILDDLKTVASRPPVLASGALKIRGVDPFSVIILVLDTDLDCAFNRTASCFFLNSVTSPAICQLLNCLIKT